MHNLIVHFLKAAFELDAGIWETDFELVLSDLVGLVNSSIEAGNYNSSIAALLKVQFPLSNYPII